MYVLYEWMTLNIFILYITYECLIVYFQVINVLLTDSEKVEKYPQS